MFHHHFTLKLYYEAFNIHRRGPMASRVASRHGNNCTNTATVHGVSLATRVRVAVVLYPRPRARAKAFDETRSQLVYISWQTPERTRRTWRAPSNTSFSLTAAYTDTWDLPYVPRQPVITAPA